MITENCITNRSKCLLLVLSFSIFLSVIFYYWKVDILWVSANPDYICVKNVTNQPCLATNYPSSCSAWTSDWFRTCPWKKATQVAYYLVRTDCESWYSKISNWWESWAASWRQWADYVNHSVACTITEEDHDSPVWEIK